METCTISLVDGRSLGFTKSLLAKSYADKQTQHATEFSSVTLSSKANSVPIRRSINRYKQKIQCNATPAKTKQKPERVSHKLASQTELSPNANSAVGCTVHSGN